MGIKIEVPLVLQQFTSGQGNVEVTGTTIRECMDDLTRQFPIYEEFFNEKNPIVWIALNKEMVSLTDRDKKVTESDSLDLLLLLGGG
jgi:hypothetical protein